MSSRKVAYYSDLRRERQCNETHQNGFVHFLSVSVICFRNFIQQLPDGI